MENVKTTVLLDKSLFHQIEMVAQNLNISRNHLFSRAIEEFIDRHKSRELIDAINMAYDDRPHQDNRHFFARSGRKKKKKGWR